MPETPLQRKEGREREEVMRGKHNGGFGRWGTNPDIMTLPLLTTVPYLSSVSLLCPLFSIPAVGTLVWLPYSLTQTSSLPISSLKSILHTGSRMNSQVQICLYHSPAFPFALLHMTSCVLSSSLSTWVPQVPGTKVSKKAESGSVRIKRGREAGCNTKCHFFMSSSHS